MLVMLIQYFKILCGVNYQTKRIDKLQPRSKSDASEPTSHILFVVKPGIWTLFVHEFLIVRYDMPTFLRGC